MKPIPFLCCLIFLSSMAYTQSQLDVIELKTGVVIQGKIIETNIPDDIKISTVSGTVITIPFSEIKSIGSSLATTPEKAIPAKYQLKKGIMFQTGMGVSIGSQLGINYLLNAGYRFSPQLSVSLGSGYQYMDEITFIVPLAARVDYALLPVAKSPYASISSGYGFHVNSNEWRQNEKGGVSIAATMGRRNNLSERVAFYFEGGFNMQKISWQEQGWWNDILVTERQINRLIFSTGFIF